VAQGFKYVCGKCGAPLALGPDGLDREVECPTCRNMVVVFSEAGARRQSIRVDEVRISDVITCPLCSKPFSKNDRFCPHCGLYRESYHINESLLRPGRTRRPIEVAKPLKTGAAVFVAGSVLILLILAATMIYFSWLANRYAKARFKRRKPSAVARKESSVGEVAPGRGAEEASGAGRAVEGGGKAIPASRPAGGAEERPEGARRRVATKAKPEPAPKPPTPIGEPKAKPERPETAIVASRPAKRPEKPAAVPENTGILGVFQAYLRIGATGDRAKGMVFLSASSRALAEKEAALPVFPFKVAGGITYWAPFAGHKSVAIDEFARSYEPISTVVEKGVTAQVLSINIASAERARIVVSHPELVREVKDGEVGLFKDVYELDFVKEGGEWRLDVTPFYEARLKQLMQRKAREAMSGIAAPKLKPMHLWVGSAPLGARVFVGPAFSSVKKVKDQRFGFPVDQLFSRAGYVKGKTPVSIKLKEGRYRVAVMLTGTPEDEIYLAGPLGRINDRQEFFARPGPKNPFQWDGAPIYLIAQDGKIVMFGKVYEVEIRKDKPAIVQAFLKKREQTYSQFLDALPKEPSFSPPRAEIEKVLKSWHNGALVSEIDLIMKFLSRGGAFAYTGEDSETLVIRMVDIDKIKVEQFSAK